MQTLEQLRARLRQVDTSSKETAKHSKRMEKMREARALSEYKGQYVINSSGTDARLNFGKHYGKTLKQISVHDSGYLLWMLGQEFPKELLDVVSYVREQLHE